MSLVLSILSAGVATPDFAKQLEEIGPQLQAIQLGRSGAGYADLIIDPDGRMISCKPAPLLGEAQIGLDFCKVLGSTPTAPARNREGKPVYYREKARYLFINSQKHLGMDVSNFEFPPDLVLVSQNLAGKKHVDVLINLFVDADGHASDCSPNGLSRADKWGQMACAELSQYKTAPFNLPSLGQVPYVTVVRVRFVSGQLKRPR